jgi:hypothetical protein
MKNAVDYVFFKLTRKCAQCVHRSVKCICSNCKYFAPLTWAAIHNVFLMFCWPCTIVYQYNDTTVMHFTFNLLRIKGLYMFRALLAHPQETLHKRHLVYCVLWHGCSFTATVPQLTDIRTQYPKCRLCRPPEDEQVMLETCKGPWFWINWMKVHHVDCIMLITCSCHMTNPCA